MLSVLLPAVFFLLIFSSIVHAKLILSDQPVTIIEGKDSKICRPEGVEFTPSGDVLAVVNSNNPSVDFYARIGENSARYETKPFVRLTGKKASLGYPHDLSFSPDGHFMAVADRKLDQINIYEIIGGEKFIRQHPVQILTKQISQLKDTNAVSFSPDGTMLAAANGKSHTVNFYAVNDGRIEEIPCQIFKANKTLLKTPDGMAFSRDSRYLAVTCHHGTFSVILFQREPGSSRWFETEPFDIVKGEHAHFCYPHSVCFYPNNQYLVSSSAAGKQTVHMFEKLSGDKPKFSHIPFLEMEIYNPKTIHMQKKHPEEGGGSKVLPFLLMVKRLLYVPLISVIITALYLFTLLRRQASNP